MKPFLWELIGYAGKVKCKRIGSFVMFENLISL
jgi:hypothetical protein